MAFNHSGFGLGLIALACVLPATTDAAKTTVNCQTTAQRVVASDLSSSTLSETFVPIPDMVTTFAQGEKGCVIVELQGIPTAPENTYHEVDARLDNNPNKHYLGNQTPIFASDISYAATVRSYKFVWSNVAPGTHTIRFYFRTNKDTNIVFMHNPTMIVNYVK